MDIEHGGTFIFDPLTGDPTILAVARAKRADQTGTSKGVTTIKPQKDESKKDKSPKPKKDVCFFCKGNENMTPPTVYQDTDDWSVRVFANKYPLLPDHEVIVHSPEHTQDIDDLPVEQTAKIIRAYLNRTYYFEKHEKEVIIFNNRGGKAGASILHPHSQIVAARGFPGTIEQEKEAALHYFNEHNSCYWCDELVLEINEQSRIVVESSHFIAYVPKACRWSYEVRLTPKFHKPNFGYIDETEINDLATVLKRVIVAYNTLFDRPDRNFWIHTMRYEPYHWHMGFMPHIKVLGGLELGAGIWVSDKATPEDAAKQLREVAKLP